MREESGQNPFVERYAQCLEYAGDLDDLAWVRDGRLVERVEAEFRGFASVFSQDATVVFADDACAEVLLGFARFDKRLRKAVLTEWADRIRARAVGSN